MQAVCLPTLTGLCLLEDSSAVKEHLGKMGDKCLSPLESLYGGFPALQRDRLKLLCYRFDELDSWQVDMEQTKQATQDVKAIHAKVQDVAEDVIQNRGCILKGNEQIRVGLLETTKRLNDLIELLRQNDMENVAKLVCEFQQGQERILQLVEQRHVESADEIAKECGDTAKKLLHGLNQVMTDVPEAFRRDLSSATDVVMDAIATLKQEFCSLIESHGWGTRKDLQALQSDLMSKFEILFHRYRNESKDYMISFLEGCFQLQLDVLAHQLRSQGRQDMADFVKEVRNMVNEKDTQQTEAIAKLLSESQQAVIDHTESTLSEFAQRQRVDRKEDVRTVLREEQGDGIRELQELVMSLQGDVTKLLKEQASNSPREERDSVPVSESGSQLLERMNELLHRLEVKVQEKERSTPKEEYDQFVKQMRELLPSLSSRNTTVQYIYHIDGSKYVVAGHGNTMVVSDRSDGIDPCDWVVTECAADKQMTTNEEGDVEGEPFIGTHSE